MQYVAQHMCVAFWSDLDILNGRQFAVTGTGSDIRSGDMTGRDKQSKKGGWLMLFPGCVGNNWRPGANLPCPNPSMQALANAPARRALLSAPRGGRVRMQVGVGGRVVDRFGWVQGPRAEHLHPRSAAMGPWRRVHRVAGVLGADALVAATEGITAASLAT